MSQFVIGALRAVKDKLPTKMLQLRGIEKPGPIGVCNQHIYIEPRPVVYSPEEFSSKIKDKTVKLADLIHYMNIVAKLANKNELVQSKTKEFINNIILMEATPEEFMESGDLRIKGTIRDAVKFRRILETTRSVLSSM